MIPENEPLAMRDADEVIFSCIDLENSKSFFLFAGAGSGKTRSLVTTLIRIKATIGLTLRLSRKKVAVITYTNAASDEIKRRLDVDPLFSVSTIHSCAWELIKSYTMDIKAALRQMLIEDTAKLEDEQRRGRAGTKVAIEREISIRQNTERLVNLGKIKQFQYSPTGDNSGKDSLNHAEVINLASSFLQNKRLLQKLLVTRYPILFIDESQDTNKLLIESFFEVQRQYPTTFTLGLFGDTMQRIYFDGKPDLGLNLPEGWLSPAKVINHRCPVRVIRLINQIRALADGREQKPRNGQDEGYARLFIVQRGTISNQLAEEKIVANMAQITGDGLWLGEGSEIKVLILEHHMAASRMGFVNFYASLSAVSSLRTMLVDGTFPGISFFTKLIVPLKHAYDASDSFGVMRILKDNSPLLKKENIKLHQDQREPFKKAKEATVALFALWENGTPTLYQIAENIYDSGLFDLPPLISLIIETTKRIEQTGVVEDDIPATAEQAEGDRDTRSKRSDAWGQALQSSYTEIEAYAKYIADDSRFGTHQGVKGREFERVMVITDDVEARGFAFSYDRIFGATPAGTSEQKNAAEGRETILDRTLRLFYVACSRAEKSLAIVAYTDAPEEVKKNAVKQGWFAESEITII
jgi:DNA helicase-2/ATP-dependent DNA helicase PcrA